ncbi:MAG TPA: hypothetical protein VIM03_01975, partial [Thermoleophilaceae bacterium]
MLENGTSAEGTASEETIAELLMQLLQHRFVLTDRGGSVTRWSTPASILFAWEAKAALGRPLLELLECDGRLGPRGGTTRTTAHRRDGRELEVDLTFVPVPMSQSLEFTGMLEALETGGGADVMIDRLYDRHASVVEWMAGCLGGHSEIAADELIAGTIVAFRPVDDGVWDELDPPDASPDHAEPSAVPPPDAGSDEVLERVEEALQRSSAIEEAFDAAAIAVEEARAGADEARDDAQA